MNTNDWPPVAEPAVANAARERGPAKLPVNAEKALERARADAAIVEKLALRFLRWN